MQIIAIVVSLAIAVVGIALFVRAIREIIGVMKVGQPAGRTDNPGSRTVTAHLVTGFAIDSMSIA